MANEQFVFIRRSDVPFRDAWQAAIDATGFDLQLDSRLQPFHDSGFVPCKLFGTEAGFEIESIVADLDGILQGETYLDPCGPLREAWRAGDSTWTLVAPDELAAAQQRVEQLNREGDMTGYLQRREARRAEVGQATFFCARK